MIDPILLAEVDLPADHPRSGEYYPVYGFVIHHREGPVLVDTGIGTGNELVDRLYSPVHFPLEDALAQQGIAPGDLVMAINSHLHFDHCGNNRLLIGVPIVVQRTEYEAAAQPGYTVPEWVEFPDASYQLISGETEVMPGIRIIPTPGHTPGHQSVVVESGTTMVIAAQALHDPQELEEARSWEELSGEESTALAASAGAIKSIRPSAVYFSHSPEVWRAD